MLKLTMMTCLLNVFLLLTVGDALKVNRVDPHDAFLIHIKEDVATQQTLATRALSDFATSEYHFKTELHELNFATVGMIDDWMAGRVTVETVATAGTSRVPLTSEPNTIAHLEEIVELGKTDALMHLADEQQIEKAFGILEADLDTELAAFKKDFEKGAKDVGNLPKGSTEEAFQKERQEALEGMESLRGDIEKGLQAAHEEAEKTEGKLSQVSTLADIVKNFYHPLGLDGAGDPRMRNARGEKFDISKQGSVDLLVITRGDEVMLKVQGVMTRTLPICRQHFACNFGLFITEVRLSGSQMPKKLVAKTEKAGKPTEPSFTMDDQEMWPLQKGDKTLSSLGLEVLNFSSSSQGVRINVMNTEMLLLHRKSHYNTCDGPNEVTFIDLHIKGVKPMLQDNTIRVGGILGLDSHDDWTGDKNCDIATKARGPELLKINAASKLYQARNVARVE